MNVFLPGGAGLVGLNLISLLVKRHPDWELLVVDKKREATEIGRKLFPNVEFICEVCEGAKLKELPAQVRVNGIPFSDAISKEMNAVIPKFQLTAKGTRIYEYLKLLRIDYLSLDRGLNTRIKYDTHGLKNNNFYKS